MKKKLISLLLILCCTTTWTLTAYSNTTDIVEQTQQKTVTVKKMTLSQKEFDTIDKIQIIWARGQVIVSKSPDEKVYITEKAFVKPKETEVVGISIKDDTLFIQDYNSLSSLSVQDSMDKKEFQELLQQYHNTEYDLLISLPEKQYKEFYFKTVNADCTLQDNTFTTVITETVNGEIQFSNVTADFINSNTVNGNIMLYTGTNAEKYYLKGINGNINASFSVFPPDLSVETVNGNITLELPENDGFTINKNKLKTYKDFSTSFALKDTNTKKVYKNGETLLDIVCTNGSVTLKKNESNEIYF